MARRNDESRVAENLQTHFDSSPMVCGIVTGMIPLQRRTSSIEHASDRSRLLLRRSQLHWLFVLNGMHDLGLRCPIEQLQGHAADNLMQGYTESSDVSRDECFFPASSFCANRYDVSRSTVSMTSLIISRMDSRSSW